MLSVDLKERVVVCAVGPHSERV
uniref:Uncharacterized protein n=1 Tax=Anguilla anguilla TaxID=7936 RepID=A0A0E9QNP7_ANGAN